DADLPANTLSATLVTGVGHGALTLNADGSFTYTPDADFNGTDTFTYRAYDGQAYSDEVAVTITVNPVNDAPVAADGSLTTAEDTAAAGTLVATDVDSPTLTYAVVTGP